jgi:excisionase family DNA binding protein
MRADFRSIKHEPMERLLLTFAESAVVLGISRSKLYTLVANGEIRRIKIGRSARIHRSELLDYVERLKP